MPISLSLSAFSYPKPGTPNPTAKLYIADLADTNDFRKRELTPPAILANE